MPIKREGIAGDPAVPSFFVGPFFGRYVLWRKKPFDPLFGAVLITAVEKK